MITDEKQVVVRPSTGEGIIVAMDREAHFVSEDVALKLVYQLLGELRRRYDRRKDRYLRDLDKSA